MNITLIKLIIIIFFIICILKIAKPDYYDKLENIIKKLFKFVQKEKFNDDTNSVTNFFYDTIKSNTQDIYPVSINFDQEVEITPDNFDGNLNSNYLNNLSNRIKKIIQSSPINMDKYVSSLKEYQTVDTSETKQIINYIKKQINGDNIKHKLDITNILDVNKVLYGGKYYIYEFKFNANYYTDQIGSHKLNNPKFINELVFVSEILAIPSNKDSIFANPLVVDKNNYDIYILKLFISGVQPRNKYLPGFAKQNEHKLISETAQPANAKFTTPNCSIDYDDIFGSVIETQ
jgi:hypothetical protein